MLAAIRRASTCLYGLRRSRAAESGGVSLRPALVALFPPSRRSAIPPAMAVAPLSHSARDYVRAFDLVSVRRWRDGRLGVSRNPKGAEQAWWCPAKVAGALVRAANANGKDVTAAAARLHTPLTDHATVAQRVEWPPQPVRTTLRLSAPARPLSSRHPAQPVFTRPTCDQWSAVSGQASLSRRTHREREIDEGPQ